MKIHLPEMSMQTVDVSIDAKDVIRKILMIRYIRINELTDKVEEVFNAHFSQWNEAFLYKLETTITNYLQHVEMEYRGKLMTPDCIALQDYTDKINEIEDEIKRLEDLQTLTKEKIENLET